MSRNKRVWRSGGHLSPGTTSHAAPLTALAQSAGRGLRIRDVRHYEPHAPIDDLQFADALNEAPAAGSVKMAQRKR